TGAPRFLTVDPYVQLRKLAFVAGIRLGHARDAANGREDSSGFDLEPRHFRSLNVDLDRLAAPTKDALLSLNRRSNVRQLDELFPKVPLNGEQRTSFGLRTESNIDIAVVDSATAAAAHGQIREIDVGLFTKKIGDFAALAKSVRQR